MDDHLKTSPTHTASNESLSLDQTIELFEAQMNGWILDHATALTASTYPNREHAGFAILLLVTSYFEAIEPYFVGAKIGKSHEVFRSGFRRVFTELAGVPGLAIDSVYGELRCGLYHAAATGGRIQISHLEQPLEIKLTSDGLDLASAVVDPWRVLDRVSSHFREYVGKLKDASEVQLRTAFEAATFGRPRALTTFIPHKISSTF